MKSLWVFFLLFSFPSFAKGEFLPKSFSANFEQIFISTVSGKEKKSWGKLDYLYPSKVRFEILRPDNVIFVADKKKTWHYTAPFIEGEVGQLIIRNAGQMALSEFLDKLQLGLKSNEFYNVSYVGDTIELIMTETFGKKIGLIKGILGPKGGPKSKFSDFSEVTLVYQDKKNVILKFSKILESPKFSINHFKIVPPNNTRVVNQ